MDKGLVPSHVAFIPDGNRRWARENGVPNRKAYDIGAQKFEKILDWCMEAGVSHVSAYVLSAENSRMRSRSELKEIFGTICDFMERWLKPGSIVDRYEIKVNFVGNPLMLPSRLKDIIKKMIQKTSRYKKRLVNMMIGYSGKEEIVSAMKKIAKKFLSGTRLSISQKSIQRNMSVKQPVDLVIRTGGQNRLSNFMIWQTAYAEIYTTKTFWPDFSKKDFNKAIAFFADTKRNFGA